MRSRVYRHMLETRGWKYRVFLRYLRLFKYFSFSWNRGSFLESYYTLMRYIDDIVDGDVPLPDGYTHVADYVEDKIRFSRNPQNPVDEVDYLMLHCYEIAKRIGAEFSSETEDILGSLLFDAQRRGTLEVFPHEVLARHFHLLDIRGTIKATLKIFNEDPDKYHLLEPLGMACRYEYDLEDFSDDIAAGYVNISQEEMTVLGISHSEFNERLSPGILRWFKYRALRGMDLLTRHERIMEQKDFGLLARMTFPLVYVRPARKCFEKVLAYTMDVTLDYKRAHGDINQMYRHEASKVLFE